MLEDDRLNGRAIDGEAQNFAQSSIVGGISGERDGEQLDRRRAHDVVAFLRKTTGLVSGNLDHVSAVETEVERLIAQRASHQNFDGRNERASAPVVVVCEKHSAPSSLPLRDFESSGADELTVSI